MKTLSGDEHFYFGGMPAGFLLNDFWAWQASDLLNNTLRGVLAEFIVATALGNNISQARQDWDAYDLLYDNRWRIEVKSSARLQSWEQKMPSRVQFSIRPTRAWSADEGYSKTVVRQSDIYTFCFFSCEVRDAANPLMLDQWEFYLLPTFIINEKCGCQRSISLSSLLDLHPEKSDYGILGARMRRMLLRNTTTYAQDEIDRLSEQIEMHELLRANK